MFVETRAQFHQIDGITASEAKRDFFVKNGLASFLFTSIFFSHVSANRLENLRVVGTGAKLEINLCGLSNQLVVHYNFAENG